MTKIKFDFERLPEGCRNLVREFYNHPMCYRLARSDIVNALKLERQSKHNPIIYVVKSGPFRGVAFLRRSPQTPA